jgi:hypothetical protein
MCVKSDHRHRPPRVPETKFALYNQAFSDAFPPPTKTFSSMFSLGKNVFAPRARTKL